MRNSFEFRAFGARGLAAGVEDWSPMCAAAIALMVTGGVVSTEAEEASGKLKWNGLVLSVIAGGVSTVGGLLLEQAVDLLAYSSESACRHLRMIG